MSSQTTIRFVELRGVDCMDDNQDYISALVDICKDFVEYLKSLKEKGFISEEEFQKHTRSKIMFIQKMGK
jgi:hypothetical protein